MRKLTCQSASLSVSIVKREVRFLAPTELSMLSNVELVEFRSVGDASEEGDSPLYT